MLPRPAAAPSCLISHLQTRVQCQTSLMLALAVEWQDRDDMEKEKEVVRENGSLRTVWKQCCQSPWVCQTQKSKESDIVMVNYEEMNAGRRPGQASLESESDTPKDFGNIASIVSLGLRFP